MGMRSPPDRQSPLGGERVLVVEDNAVVAMLVEDEPRGAGAEVEGPAGSVGDALRLVGKRRQRAGWAPRCSTSGAKR